MSRSITRSDEYHTGTTVERKLEGWLQAHGYSVVRVRHGGDVAPVLRIWDRQVVLPDLQLIWEARLPVWLEVKAKTTCGFYEVMRERTTGIDERLVEEYRLIKRVTGYPVFVAFCHKDEDEVRVAHVTESKSFLGSGNGASMRYWFYDRLECLTAYSAIMSTPARMVRAADEPLFSPEQREQLSLPGMTRI